MMCTISNQNIVKEIILVVFVFVANVEPEIYAMMDNYVKCCKSAIVNPSWSKKQSCYDQCPKVNTSLNKRLLTTFECARVHLVSTP